MPRLRNYSLRHDVDERKGGKKPGRKRVAILLLIKEEVERMHLFIKKLNMVVHDCHVNSLEAGPEN